MSVFGLIRRAKTGGIAPANPIMRELPVQPPVEQTPPQPPTSNELQQILFDAIAAGDEEGLASLCREHRELIADYAATWMIVPDGLCANAAAAEWYARGVKQLVQFQIEPSA